jgi:hypothetical protein
MWDLPEPTGAWKKANPELKKKNYLNPANSSLHSCPISDERQSTQECRYDVPSRVKFEIADVKILS